MSRSENKNPGLRNTNAAKSSAGNGISQSKTAQPRRQLRRIGRTFYYVVEPDPATKDSSCPAKTVCQPQVAGACVAFIDQAAVG